MNHTPCYIPHNAISTVAVLVAILCCTQLSTLSAADNTGVSPLYFMSRTRSVDLNAIKPLMLSGVEAEVRGELSDLVLGTMRLHNGSDGGPIKITAVQIPIATGTLPDPAFPNLTTVIANIGVRDIFTRHSAHWNTPGQVPYAFGGVLSFTDTSPFMSSYPLSLGAAVILGNRKVKEIKESLEPFKVYGNFDVDVRLSNWYGVLAGCAPPFIWNFYGIAEVAYRLTPPTTNTYSAKAKDLTQNIAITKAQVELEKLIAWHLRFNNGDRDLFIWVNRTPTLAIVNGLDWECAYSAIISETDIDVPPGFEQVWPLPIGDFPAAPLPPGLPPVEPPVILPAAGGSGGGSLPG